MENKDKEGAQLSVGTIGPNISLSSEGQQTLANILVSEPKEPTSAMQELFALPNFSKS